MDAVLLAAARPWTYWIAPVLVAVGISAIVAMALGYYRQVLDPWYRMLDERARRELSSATTEVTHLPGARGSRERPAPPRLAA